MPPQRGYGEYRFACIEGMYFGARPQGVSASLGPLMFALPNVASFARQSEPNRAESAAIHGNRRDLRQ
jgi:hypothetical protein